MANPLDLLVTLEECSDIIRILGGAFDAQWQGARTACDQPGVER